MVISEVKVDTFGNEKYGQKTRKILVLVTSVGEDLNFIVRYTY